MYNPIAIAKTDQMICSMMLTQRVRVYIQMGTIEESTPDVIIS
jgi:hypothetical protein